MSINRRVAVAGFLAVVMLALISAAPVQAITPYRWEYSCAMTGLAPPNPTLDGWVKGEGLEGRMYWVNTGRFFAGETIHMYGYWAIIWSDGTEIHGEHTGVWSLSNNRVNVRGVVTYTVGGWSDLVGRHIHTVETFDLQTMSIGGIFQIN